LEEDVSGSFVLKLTGCVTSLTGETHIERVLEEVIASLDDAEKLGEKLAGLLMDSGAKKILKDITDDRERRSGETIQQAST
jgi:hydroxymethylbilane synthase